MNSDQIGGIVRAVGGVAVGYLVGNGYITSDVGAWFITGAATLAIGAWSWWTNRPGTVIAAKP